MLLHFAAKSSVKVLSRKLNLCSSHVKNRSRSTPRCVASWLSMPFTKSSVKILLVDNARSHIVGRSNSMYFKPAILIAGPASLSFDVANVNYANFAHEQRYVQMILTFCSAVNG